MDTKIGELKQTRTKKVKNTEFEKKHQKACDWDIELIKCCAEGGVY